MSCQFKVGDIVSFQDKKKRRYIVVQILKIHNRSNGWSTIKIVEDRNGWAHRGQISGDHMDKRWKLVNTSVPKFKVLKTSMNKRRPTLVGTY